jgi:hypothetical protein
MTFRMNCIASVWQAPDGTGALPCMLKRGDVTCGLPGNLPERSERAE